jgi:hypothetical protein
VGQAQVLKAAASLGGEVNLPSIPH